MSKSTVHDTPTVSVRSLVEYPLPRGQLVLGVRGTARLGTAHA